MKLKHLHFARVGINLLCEFTLKTMNYANSANLISTVASFAKVIERYLVKIR